MLTFGDPAAAGRCGGAARYRAGITHQLTDAWHRYRLTRNDMERALIATKWAGSHSRTVQS